MKSWFFCLSLASIVFGFDAYAAVVDEPDIVDFEAAHNGTPGPSNVNIRQYSATDASGGGQFVLMSSGCTSDHGVILKDLDSNCYYRQFSGPLHLS